MVPPSFTRSYPERNSMWPKILKHQIWLIFLTSLKINPTNFYCLIHDLFIPLCFQIKQQWARTINHFLMFCKLFTCLQIHPLIRFLYKLRFNVHNLSKYILFYCHILIFIKSLNNALILSNILVFIQNHNFKEGRLFPLSL